MSNRLPAAPATSRGLRKRVGIGIALVGFVIFLLGAQPEWFGWQGSPVVGIVQIQVFITGLGLIALGGYFTMEALWRNKEKLILTELGARLVGTGYVIALTSGMADVFGLGTRPLPAPFFGYWQGRGVLIGQLVIFLGLLMMAPWWAEVDVRRWLVRLRSLLLNGRARKNKGTKS
ncbi:MAG: hypothetical protein KIS85_00490 [Anaerolineales bacterium]|nr:hypothetical protein [Anaerolineales bacterium]